MERSKALQIKVAIVLACLAFLWLTFVVVLNKSKADQNELLIKATIDRLSVQTIPSIQTIIGELRSDKEKLLWFYTRVEKLEGITSKLPPLIRAGGERLPMGDTERELAGFYSVTTEIPEFNFQQIAEQAR